MPPFEQRDGRGRWRRLGGGREERTEGDVVGAELGRGEAEVARVVTGDTDDAVGPKGAPRLGVARVLLADVDAVGIGGEREVRTVVDQEGDVALTADVAQRIGRAQHGGVLDALQAQLHRGDIAGVEGARQHGREVRRQRGRGQQVESRREISHGFPWRAFRLYPWRAFRATAAFLPDPARGRAVDGQSWLPVCFHVFS